jgi:hypothetical protein
MKVRAQRAAITIVRLVTCNTYGLWVIYFGVFVCRGASDLIIRRLWGAPTFLHVHGICSWSAWIGREGEYELTLYVTTVVWVD